jgi:methionine-rich copper-binding protein CopC/putative copper export protein/ABC-type branched-subunit amino acid transport system substrate-binding protein
MRDANELTMRSHLLRASTRSHSVSHRAFSWRARISTSLAIVVASLVLLAAPASAHPYYVHSSPTANSVLSASPKGIEISYTEGLDLSYCVVTIVGPHGQQITTHVTRGAASNELEASLDQPLSQPGTYAVEWTAVGDDGHTVIGVFAISLDHTSSNSEVTAGAAPDSGSSGQPAAQLLLRVLLPAATVLVVALLFLGTVMADAVAATTRERRALVGRRFLRLRWIGAGGLAAIVVGLVLQGIISGGLSAFWQSDLGRRLIFELAFVGFLAPLLFDGGALGAGRSATRVRQIWGYVVGLGLLVVLAVSSHVLTQPESRRWAALAVYVIHLGAVSVWIGALLVVTVPLGREVAQLAENLSRLRRLVAVSIIAVLVTGVLNSAWAIRSLGQLVETGYGGVVIAKFALFSLVVALGLIATVQFRSRRGQFADDGLAKSKKREGRSTRFLFAELVVASATLLLAGVLGELPQPLDFPLSSVLYASSVGLPVSTGVIGPYTAVGTVTPGLVGSNQLVVRLTKADINQFLQPVSKVKSVTAKVICGCRAGSTNVALHPVPGGPWWSSNVNLPAAAAWSFSVHFGLDGDHAEATDPSTTLSAQVEPKSLPSQVVVGVAADLSGSQGEQCQNEVLGLQTAFSDVNTQAVDHGNLVRVIAFNIHQHLSTQMSKLFSTNPSVLALPCGTPQEVAEATQEARAHHIPVIASSELKTTPGVWSLGPNWTDEGQSIAEQAHTQGAALVNVVVGSSAIDHEELQGFSSVAKRLHIDEQVSSIRSNADDLVFQLASVQDPYSAIVILANPDEATQFTSALSTMNLNTNWVPPRGILTSSQLMNTDYINDAGQITRVGELEIGSTINPFDPVDMYYAQRLRTLTPGILPTFEGVEGYNAALTISAALRMGGGDPSPSQLFSLFSTKFKNFESGSYRAAWSANGGSASQLAFFRPTYINPLALPANTPAGAQAMTHEGTFLDSGGFEQVSPFQDLR